MPKIRIRTNERVFIAGKTGSGKTYAALRLLESVKRLVVIDSKDGLDGENLTNFDNSFYKKISNGNDFRVRIVQDQQAVDVLKVCYDFGNVTIYVDEVNAIIPPNARPDQVFVDIWQRGRSRGIGAWASSQRPVSVPLIFLSEAEHIFAFRLNLDSDRKRIAEFTGKSVLNPVVDMHGFYYYSIEDGQSRYYRKLDL